MVKLTPAILRSVVKPARYTGRELHSVQKDLHTVAFHIALALPDVYEVGMSNLGLKILYHALNRREDLYAERVYAPWVDMEAQMRKRQIPLYGLESFAPLRGFDMVGFSLQYELSYSNVLNMLDLAGITLFTAQRREEEPFIVGGGPCAYNPEPIADFFDFFIIGEGEEVLLEVADAHIQWKRDGRAGGRAGFLRRAAAIDGVYVPSLYDVQYDGDGLTCAVAPKVQEARPVVYKRLVHDLDGAPFMDHPVVPYIDIVHNRILLELFRGCTRSCRFCQAGIVYRPVRERSKKRLLELARKLVDSTGYNELSLTSLSSADYSCLHGLVDELMEEFKAEGVSVSLPSLRIDSFSVALAQKVQQVRKSGLTFAPEAGTQRLRDVINKGVTDEDLIQAASAAFQAGWSAVKLYFMIGLPTETDADVAGIAALAKKVVDLYKNIHGRRGASVTVSVSSFVPKPHTAFQWFAQNTEEELHRKQRLLKEQITDRAIHYKYHDARTSFMEGVFARGDRRLGQVLFKAWQKGAKFDGWSEHFKYETYVDAFRECGIDPLFYNQRERSFAELLPWEHISPAVSKDFLWRECENALRGSLTPDCRRGACSGCGVCPSLNAKVVDWSEKARC